MKEWVLLMFLTLFCAYLSGQNSSDLPFSISPLNQAEETFPLGTTWTYEFFEEQLVPNRRPVSYIRYEVSDTLRRGDTLVYMLTNNRDRPTAFFYEQDRQIYFEEAFGWAKHYDFGANVEYPITMASEWRTTATIDSIIDSYPMGDRGIQRTQIVTYPEYGDQLTDGQPLQVEILNDVGKLYGGPTLSLFTVRDYSTQIGQLRCFESGDFSWNFDQSFEPIACDSTYTEILNSTSAVNDLISISAYPNPATTSVTVDAGGIDLPYQLFDAYGRLITSGSLAEGPIFLPDTGLYFVRVFDGLVNRTLRVISR